MLSLIRCSELPPGFIRTYRPVVCHAHERGLPRHLFDPLGIGFHREVATEPVLDSHVWSLVADGDAAALRLIPGEIHGALGFVIAALPRTGDNASTWSIPRRLTPRQRVRRAVCEELLAAIADAGVATIADVRSLLMNRINGSV